MIPGLAGPALGSVVGGYRRSVPHEFRLARNVSVSEVNMERNQAYSADNEWLWNGGGLSLLIILVQTPLEVLGPHSEYLLCE